MEGIVACRAVVVHRPQDGRYTRAVTEQWIGKLILAATGTDTTIEGLCFLRGPCREFKSETRFGA
jgi:hypothetical protein